MMQVTDAVKVLYVLRKDEEKVSFRTEIKSFFDMEACLVNLAQRQIDLEDEENDLTSKVTSMLLRSQRSCVTTAASDQDQSNVNLLQDEIDARLGELRFIIEWCHLKLSSWLRWQHFM